MNRECTQCPPLRAENAHLRRRIEFLFRLVSQLRGGIRSTITFIESEQDTPTMPRRTLVPAVHARLTHVAEQAEGQRI